MKKKVIMSWSTGKDSAFALHVIRQTSQYQVMGLLTTISEEYDRVSMHGIRNQLLKQQAERLGLPSYEVLIPSPYIKDIYEMRMEKVLNRFIDIKTTHIVFGDLYLEDIRKYREAKLAPTNLVPLFPLWKIDTLHLANEIINSGIKAVITCVDSKKLDSSFLGQEFNQEFLKKLPKGTDPCGENGEFHTFVYDSPMFYKPISIKLGEIIQHDEFIFRDVSPLEV